MHSVLLKASIRLFSSVKRTETLGPRLVRSSSYALSTTEGLNLTVLQCETHRDLGAEASKEQLLCTQYY